MALITTPREVIFAPFMGARKLCIGCGMYPHTEPGWVNLDMNPESPAEVHHDLHSLPLPFPDESFDTVYASHVLEHIEQPLLIPLVYDIARILKTGGHLISIVPQGLCNAAWENPHHRQRFTVGTFSYFDKKLYEVEHSMGTGAGQGFKYADWNIVYSSATPTQHWAGKPEDEIFGATPTYNNVLLEIQVVMRKDSM